MTDATPTQLEKLNDLRQRIVNEEEVSREELAEALQALRASRTVAVQKKAAKKAKAEPIDLNALFQ